MVVDIPINCCVGLLHLVPILKKLGRYLRVNLLGPGPRLIKKNLPGRGLTKVENPCFRTWYTHSEPIFD